MANFHAVFLFSSDIDETVAWIAEKDATLSSDDFGRDLTTVQALQRKHEGTERDLAALEGKVYRKYFHFLWILKLVFG